MWNYKDLQPEKISTKSLDLTLEYGYRQLRELGRGVVGLFVFFPGF